MKQALLFTVSLLCAGFLLPQMALGVWQEQTRPALGQDRKADADASLDLLQVHPNPTYDFFRISQPAAIERIELYNSLGTRVGTFRASPEGQYPIYTLPAGLYMVGLYDAEGTLLKTVRLSKVNLQP